MKNIRLNILFLLLPFLLAANMPEGRYKREKIIRQQYEVGRDGKVQIDNSYGNINVITWQQNKVDIKVTITVDGNDLDAVSKRIKSIWVDINKSPMRVTAVTHIGSSSQSWSLFSWFFGKSHQTNFQINYEVRMPENFDLKLTNDYGNIFINKLSGRLDLNADYGKFEIGELLHTQNEINTDYLSTSHIDFVKQAEINADYSKIIIDSAYKLRLNCDYSTIKIKDVRFIKFNNDYGSINIANGKEIYGSGDYATRNFGGIAVLKFEGDYGSVHVKSLSKNFDQVHLVCDYTTIKIENPEQVPYRVDIQQEYGCFKHSGLEIYREINDNGDKEIKAYYLDRNAPSIIKITEDYGCIKIYN